jgi:3-phosphoglycerate kinase
MIVVETMFFDSDDYDVSTDVIPCDSKETAKAVVEKVYEKILEDYNFDDEEDRKDWENESVKRKKDGSIYIKGGDCGYAKINIIDKELVTANTLSSLEVEVGIFY